VRFSTFAFTFGAFLCCAHHGLADSCATTPGNLVANCDFEDGTYTSTIPFLPFPPNSDPGVPNFWRADIGFIENYIISGESTDEVVTDPMTGTDSLSMGASEFNPAGATLSQSLTDVSGATYVGDVNESVGVSVLIDGQMVSANGGSFSFTGTGDDELSLYVINPAFGFAGPFDVSDMVITPAVPEPRGTLLIPIAMLACLVWVSKRRPTLHL
jgi:hypothetical protein